MLRTDSFSKASHLEHRPHADLHTALVRAISEERLIGAGSEAAVFALTADKVVRISRTPSHGWLDQPTVYAVPNQQTREKCPAAILPEFALVAANTQKTQQRAASANPSVMLRNPSYNQLSDKVAFCDAMVMPRVAGSSIASAFADKFNQLLVSKKYLKKLNVLQKITAVQEIQTATFSKQSATPNLQREIGSLQQELTTIGGSQKASLILSIAQDFLRQALRAHETRLEHEPNAPHFGYTDLDGHQSDTKKAQIDALHYLNDPLTWNEIIRLPIAKIRVRRRFIKKYERFADAYITQIQEISHVPQQSFDELLASLDSLQQKGYGIDVDHGDNIFFDRQNNKISLIDICEPANANIENRQISLERLFLGLSGRDYVHTFKTIIKDSDRDKLRVPLQTIVNKLSQAAEATHLRWRIDGKTTTAAASKDDAVAPCQQLFNSFGLTLPGAENIRPTRLAQQ